MRKLLTAVAIGAFAIASASPALALDPAGPADSTTEKPVDQQGAETTNPAPSMEETGAIGRVPLETGENSFTEGQAKERLEAFGLTNVGVLTLDDQGIWRGTASKGSTVVKVGLDFKGNIAVESAVAQ